MLACINACVVCHLNPIYIETAPNKKDPKDRKDPLS